MTWLVAVGLAGVLAHTAVAAPEGVIAGRVLDASTNAPLPGVQVMLIEQPSREPGRAPFSSQPKTQVTDDNGRFAFTNLQAGRYHLNARKTGFATSFDRTSQRSFDVTGAERFESIELRLQRGGAISGRVLDQSGEPVFDVRVIAFRKAPEPSTMGERRDAPVEGAPPEPPRAVPPAANGRGWVGSILGTLPDAPMPARPGLMMPGGGDQTDDLGEFRIHSLAPGDYYIQAAPRGDIGGVQAGGGQSTLVATFYPGTAHADAAQPIAVTPGETTTDVVVRMLSEAAFRVSGVVVDEAGQPMPDAMVRLVGTDQTSSTFPTGGRNSHARTDTSGAFTIGNVTSGEYALIAIPPVVVGRTPTSGAVTWGSSSMSMVTGTVAGGPGGSVTTEIRNGITVRYDEGTGSRVAVTVTDSSVADLRVVVKRPAR